MYNYNVMYSYNELYNYNVMYSYNVLYVSLYSCLIRCLYYGINSLIFNFYGFIKAILIMVLITVFKFVLNIIYRYLNRELYCSLK